MATESIDPRIVAAQEEFKQADDARDRARCVLLNAYGEVLKGCGYDPTSITVPERGWDCKESPLGKCAYDFFEDPSRDDCIFCHDPEERK